MSLVDDNDPRALAEQLTRAHELIRIHLEEVVAHQPQIQTVEYDAEIPRWYVRFGCDSRDAATIYFDLHQRSLHYELYFLPDSGRNQLELYHFLLSRNHNLYGASFSLGPDGDTYLTGRIALEYLSARELDRIIGVLYEITEQWFSLIVQMAYRLADQSDS